MIARIEDKDGWSGRGISRPRTRPVTVQEQQYCEAFNKDWPFLDIVVDSIAGKVAASIEFSWNCRFAVMGGTPGAMVEKFHAWATAGGSSEWSSDAILAWAGEDQRKREWLGLPRDK